MDNFAEYLVKKQPTGSEKLKNIMSMIGMIILTAALFVLGIMLRGGIINFVLLIFALMSGVATFFTIRNTRVEYEYTFTNGDLDIDKIIAQSKRKEMLSVHVGKFTDFGKYTENAPDETADMTVIMATDNIASHEWYADFPHDEYGKCRLIFCPDERMLSNMKIFLHPSIRNKAAQEMQKSHVNDLASDI